MKLKNSKFSKATFALFMLVVIGFIVVHLVLKHQEVSYFRDKILRATVAGIEMCSYSGRHISKTCERMDSKDEERFLRALQTAEFSLLPSKAERTRDAIIKIKVSNEDGSELVCFNLIEYKKIPKRVYLNQIDVDASCDVINKFESGNLVVNLKEDSFP